jgi:hypothetical protein
MEGPKFGGLRGLEIDYYLFTISPEIGGQGVDSNLILVFNNNEEATAK